MRLLTRYVLREISQIFLVTLVSLTTLMVTHSMQQAVHLGDRIVMMHKGRVLHDLQGSERARARPEDLLSRFEDVRRREQLDAPVAEMLRQNYV